MAASGQDTLPPAGSDIFGQYDSVIACACALILMLAVAAIDKLTGYDMHLGILQLLPVAIITWFGGRLWGFALSAAAVGIWLVMFRTSANFPTHPYYYWDGLVLLGTLLIFVLLLARVREELDCTNAELLDILEGLDTPVYVADPKQKAVLFANRPFRETFLGRPFDSLTSLPAKECSMHWPDGRRVLLRVLSEGRRK